MPKPWNEIAIFYRDLIERGMQIRGMLDLVEQIATSRYATWQGPYLRISPRFDGTIEFRYIDTQIVSRQWHRVVKEGEAFARLIGFFDQLHWFSGSNG